MVKTIFRTNQREHIYSINLSMPGLGALYRLLLLQTLPDSVKNMTVDAFKSTANLKPSILGSSWNLNPSFLI